MVVLVLVKGGKQCQILVLRLRLEFDNTIFLEMLLIRYDTVQWRVDSGYIFYIFSIVSNKGHYNSVSITPQHSYIIYNFFGG